MHSFMFNGIMQRAWGSGVGYRGCGYMRKLTNNSRKKKSGNNRFLSVLMAARPLCILYSINVDYVRRRGSCVHKASFYPHTTNNEVMYLYQRR